MPVESHSDYWSKGPIVLLLLRLVMWEATIERVKRRGTTLVFRGSLMLRSVLGSGIGIFAWAMFADWKHEDTWVLTAGAFFIFLTAVGWPSTITVSDIGVEQGRWWRPKTLIPWKEVTAIEANKGGDRTVFGISGKNITLTRYHADPIAFEYEVKRRAQLKETLDASAPLTLGLREYPRIPVGLHGQHKMTRRERQRERENH
jgi:hypothetical protein